MDAERLRSPVPDRYNARRRDESISIEALPDSALRAELVQLAEELGYTPELV